MIDLGYKASLRLTWEKKNKNNPVLEEKKKCYVGKVAVCLLALALPLLASLTEMPATSQEEHVRRWVLVSAMHPYTRQVMEIESNSCLCTSPGNVFVVRALGIQQE